MTETLAQLEAEYTRLKGYNVGLFSNPEALEYHNFLLKVAYHRIQEFKEKTVDRNSLLNT